MPPVIGALITRVVPRPRIPVCAVIAGLIFQLISPWTVIGSIVSGAVIRPIAAVFVNAWAVIRPVTLVIIGSITIAIIGPIVRRIIITTGTNVRAIT
tara:strand:- start:587 stop:877 length:291 start_codon:yes stop_codon:yes gene_type:complete